MISALRREFNQRFTQAKYQQFLANIAARSGTEVKFRLSETPCFFPAALIQAMQKAGAELVNQLVGNEAYLAEARQQIPEGFRAPNETKKPLFLQADFGLIRDETGAIAPRLVEIQAFPSLYAFQPQLEAAYRETYRLGDAAIAACVQLQRAILGDHDPENVIL